MRSDKPEEIVIRDLARRMARGGWECSDLIRIVTSAYTEALATAGAEVRARRLAIGLSAVDLAGRAVREHRAPPSAAVSLNRWELGRSPMPGAATRGALLEALAAAEAAHAGGAAPAAEVLGALARGAQDGAAVLARARAVGLRAADIARTLAEQLGGSPRHYAGALSLWARHGAPLAPYVAAAVLATVEAAERADGAAWPRGGAPSAPPIAGVAKPAGRFADVLDLGRRGEG